jgi:hypothetical protein
MDEVATSRRYPTAVGRMVGLRRRAAVAAAAVLMLLVAQLPASAVASAATHKRFSISDATYKHGAYTVHRGRTYTLIAHARTRPRYVDASPAGRRPFGLDHYFHHAGTHRWKIAVTMNRNLRSHRFWNLGIKVGHTVHSIRVRVLGPKRPAPQPPQPPIVGSVHHA